MKTSYLKPILPLRDIVIFPSMIVPLFVGRIKSIKALEYAEKIFKSNGRTLEEEVPNFDANYKIAQRLAKGGYAKRKDMELDKAKDWLESILSR